jgi:hypothetical protein
VKNLLEEGMTLVSTIFRGKSFIFQNSRNFQNPTHRMANREGKRGEIKRELGNVLQENTNIRNRQRKEGRSEKRSRKCKENDKEEKEGGK